MIQSDFFSETRANDRKDRGQKAVLDHEAESWKDEALLVIESVARRLKIFTSDDIRKSFKRACYLPPSNPNSWGAVMSAAAKLKIIKKTGRYVKSEVVSSHGRLIAEWESMI